MSESARKRNRISLSCNYCRKRKVKCDRNRPCSLCVKYNVAKECTYDGFYTSKTQPSGNFNTQPVFMVDNIRSFDEVSPTNTTPGSMTSQMSSQMSHLPSESSKSSGLLDKSAGSSHIPGASDKLVESELDIIKQKIKNLEDNIKNKRDANPVGPVNESWQALFPKLSENPRISQPTPQAYINGTPVGWSNGNNIPAEITTQTNSYRAKFLAKNPYLHAEEPVNFYEGMHSMFSKEVNRRQNFGIFTWQAYVVKDRLTRKLMEHFSLKNTVPESSAFVANTGLEESKVPNVDDKLQDGNQEEVFKRKAQETLDFQKGDSNAGFKLRNEAKNKPEEKKYQSALALGLVIEEPLDSNLELAEKIRKALPCKRVIWLLINKFFAYVYPYMSFIDEVSFKSEIARMLGPEDHVPEYVEKINLEHGLDYAYLGLLLILIRFGYLCSFHNRQEINQANLDSTDPSPEAQELKFLLSHPISIQVVHLAYQCLDQFDVARKTSTIVLQLMFIIRLYHMFGPEEGDGADIGMAQVSNSMIIQSAYRMGVNREPELFTPGNTDEKVNNLYRKLWYFMMICDLNQGYQFGTPLCVNEDYYDTRLPFYQKGNENILDTSMEKDVISTFSYFERYSSKLVGILNVVLSLRSKVKMAEFLQMFSDLEMFVFQSFGNIEDFTIPFNQDLYHYPFIKTMKCKNFINLNGFVISMLSHLYCHYDRMEQVDLAAYYWKKIFSICCVSVSPFIEELISNNHTNFGPGSDLILNPTILAFMHKAAQLILTLLLRVNAAIIYLKKQPGHSQKMSTHTYQQRFYQYCRLSKIAESNGRHLISCMLRLSHRYYYAWRVSKAQNFLLSTYVTNQLYEEADFSEVAQSFLKISMNDIDELLHIFETAMIRIKENKLNWNENPNASSKEKTSKEKNASKPSGIPTSGSPLKFPSFSASNTPSQLFEPEVLDLGPSPASNSSSIDNDYQQMLNNKEIDDLWVQLLNDSNKEDIPKFDTNQVLNQVDNTANDPEFLEYFQNFIDSIS